MSVNLLSDLTVIRDAKSGRCSSWDTTGRNADAWPIEPGETRVLADINGPGCINHIWMTQRNHYRECLIKITWDNAQYPSVLCPLGDFFCLGNSIVNSFESMLFTASTNNNHRFDQGCALNAYVQMPFKERALVELVNESRERHVQFFYIDYETYDQPVENQGYFHAQFRRENPFGGWGPEIQVNSAEANIVNEKKTAWENNYVILDTKGKGHYIGCNLSVTNFKGEWWGEGDDMIWVDGYKWPPDLHGTGSEDYLNQAWGMQPNAFLRNGSSVYERNTRSDMTDWRKIKRGNGGYQSSYVFHVENPVRFQKEIKVTIEHGHGNHLCNDMSSVAYWYADKPCRACKVPTVKKRMPVLRDNQGNWLIDKKTQTASRAIKPNAEMKKMKAKWSAST